MTDDEAAEKLKLMVAAFSMHEHRWWATYNAVLSGAVAAGLDDVNSTHHGVRYRARYKAIEEADAAHGGLEK